MIEMLPLLSFAILLALGMPIGYALGLTGAAGVAMARICTPEMRCVGYDEGLAVGAVAVAGTLAIMIPQSLGLILYGVMTETSIGDLFIAGIIPGVISAASYALVVAAWMRINPAVAPQAARSPKSEVASGFKRVWPAISLIVFLLLGICSGAIAPTEAAGGRAAPAACVHPKDASDRRENMQKLAC